jgi:hypothetical protein
MIRRWSLPAALGAILVLAGCATPPVDRSAASVAPAAEPTAQRRAVAFLTIGGARAPVPPVPAGCETAIADGASVACPVRVSARALDADGPTADAIRGQLQAGSAIVLLGPAAATAGPVSLPAPSGGDSVAAVLREPPPAAPGAGLLPGVLIEPAFVSQGLLGRTATAVARGDAPVALGLDDGSLVRIADGEPWEVAGDRPVVLIERGGDATRPLMGLRFSVLWPGDRFDPVAGRILPASGTRSPVRVRRGERGPSRTDIFTDGAVLQLADRLVESASDRAIGRAEQGRVRVTLRRTDETEVFVAGPRRTIVRLALDVERAGAAAPTTPTTRPAPASARPAVAAPVRPAVSSPANDRRTPRLPAPPSPRPRGAAGR